MNYQVAPFWFYSGKVLLAVLAAIGLGLCGVNAAIFYCLLFGIAWPVAVSMRLHQLVEKGVAMNPRQASQWMVYVQGIPVQETRQVLTNPCFALENQMRAFFLRAFAGKAVLHMALLLLLIAQLAAVSPLIALAGALFGACWCTDPSRGRARCAKWPGKAGSASGGSPHMTQSGIGRGLTAVKGRWQRWIACWRGENVRGRRLASACHSSTERQSIVLLSIICVRFWSG